MNFLKKISIKKWVNEYTTKVGGIIDHILLIFWSNSRLSSSFLWELKSKQNIKGDC